MEGLKWDEGLLELNAVRAMEPNIQEVVREFAFKLG